MAFTETWLDSEVSDSDLYIEGFGTPIQLDRDKIITGKHKGGGIGIGIGIEGQNMQG